MNRFDFPPSVLYCTDPGQVNRLTAEEIRRLKGTDLGNLLRAHPRLENSLVLEVFLRLPPCELYPFEDRGLTVSKGLRGKELWVYTGQVNNTRRRHGLGILVNRDGSIYHGFFQDGDFGGFGRMVSQKGILYEGNWDGQFLKKQAKIVCPGSAKTYEGQVLENRPHGEGKFKWPEGHFYEGLFERGQREGCGTALWPDGTVYTGEFANDRIHGTGNYKGADGEEYEGQWLHSKPHGKGLHSYAGNKYTGQFVSGERSGYGEMKWADGRVYNGFWEFGKYEGRGTEETVDGELRTGIWSNGLLQREQKKRGTEVPFLNREMHEGSRMRLVRQMTDARFAHSKAILHLNDFAEIQTETELRKILQVHGKLGSFDYNMCLFLGRLQEQWVRYDSGVVYKGELSNGMKPHGVGVLITPSEMYQGGWVDGIKQGYGREITRQGNHYTGYWKNGRKAGFGIEIYPKTNAIYIGNWERNRFSGFGRLLYDNEFYMGYWEKNQQVGEGILKLESGDVYEGNFSTGTYNGMGRLTTRDGKIKEGEWESGKLMHQHRRNRSMVSIRPKGLSAVLRNNAQEGEQVFENLVLPK